MIHKDKSRYSHTNAASSWRILIQDEPGDCVITLQHRHNVNGKLKWNGVVWLDQSAHDSYHAHMNKDDKEPINIGANLSKEEKLDQGMAFLKEMAQSKIISYENDYLRPEDIHMELVSQVENKIAKEGTAAHSVSINATSAIITASGSQPAVNVCE
jgi:hypothetical protein